MKKTALLFLLFSISIASFGQLTGVKVLDKIIPNGTTDSYPTHIDSLGRGGMITLSTWQERNSIPLQRRKAGMVVRVKSATVDSTYSLGIGRANSDWYVYSTINAEKKYDFNSYIAFGNSITFGVASTVPDSSYVSRIGKEIGLTPNNQGFSGRQVIDFFDRVYSFIPNEASKQLITYMAGTNDQFYYGNNADKIANYNGMYRAQLAYMTTPKHLLGQNSLIAYSGTWSNSAFYGGAIGKTTSQNGATATFIVSGPVVYIAHTKRDGDAGTFSLSVDGVPTGTVYTSAGQNGSLLISSNGGRDYGSSLIRLDNLSNTTHTIVLTVTSGTGAGNVQLDWVGNPYGNTVSSPTLIVGGTPRQRNGQNDANITIYNNNNRENLAVLANDGLNLAWANTETNLSTIVGIDYDSGGDGVHPNNTGHRHLYDAFIRSISAVNTPVTREGARQSNILNSVFRYEYPTNSIKANKGIVFDRGTIFVRPPADGFASITSRTNSSTLNGRHLEMQDNVGNVLAFVNGSGNAGFPAISNPTSANNGSMQLFNGGIVFSRNVSTNSAVATFNKATTGTSGSNGSILNLQVAGSNRFIFDERGIVQGRGLNFSGGLQFGSVVVDSTGVNNSVNIGSGITAVTMEHKHVSASGHIADFKSNGVVKSYFDINGALYVTPEIDVTSFTIQKKSPTNNSRYLELKDVNGNVIGFINGSGNTGFPAISNPTSANNASIQLMTGGMVFSRNVSTNSAIASFNKLTTGSSGADGSILNLQLAGASKFIFDERGILQARGINFLNGLQYGSVTVDSTGVNASVNIGSNLTAVTAEHKHPLANGNIFDIKSNGTIKASFDIDGNMFYNPSTANTLAKFGPNKKLTSAVEDLDYATPASVALKQNLITLTTTGSGASTFNQSTGALNIPNPSGTFVDLSSAQTVGGSKNFTSTMFGTNGYFSENLGSRIHGFPINATDLAVNDPSNQIYSIPSSAGAINGLRFRSSSAAVGAAPNTTTDLVFTSTAARKITYQDRDGIVDYILKPISTKTANYTALITDHTILSDASSGNITISLPSAASVQGLILVVKKIDSGANTVTIDPSGAELIEFASTAVLASQGDSIMFQSNGTAWYIL